MHEDLKKREAEVELQIALDTVNRALRRLADLGVYKIVNVKDISREIDEKPVPFLRIEDRSAYSGKMEGVFSTTTPGLKSAQRYAK